MRTILIAGAISGAAAVVLAGFGFEARAGTIVVGGLAATCSRDAKAGRADAALEHCTLALVRDPLSAHDRASTLVNRGAVYLMQRQTARASADFEEAAKLDPTLGEAYVGRGGVLVAMERWAEADAEITHGLDLGVEEAEKAYFFRGVARWGQDDLKGAYLDFRKAQALAPKWKLPAEQLAYFKATPVRSTPTR